MYVGKNWALWTHPINPVMVRVHRRVRGLDPIIK